MKRKRMKKHVIRNVSLLLVVALMAIPGSAQVPQQISYQGYLTESGQPLTDSVELSFSIYSEDTWGTPLWSETHGSVPVTNGTFTVILGSVTPLDLAFEQPYWVDIEVNGAPFTLRQPLTAAPYALRARTCDDVSALQSQIDALQALVDQLVGFHEVCGDGVCIGSEDEVNCLIDCSDAVCGDSVCEDLENTSNCPTDCPAVCGDGICTYPENADSCLVDCPEICGDGFCSQNENALSCEAECPAVCGDGWCTHDEDAASCPADCP